MKRNEPAVRFSGEKVTPDEVGFDLLYTVVNPSIDAQWFGTAVGTSTQTPTFGIINGYADYPRNVRYVLGAASGSTAGGTIVITGKDQFGSGVTETLGVATAANGGTTVGTQVFAQVTAVSCTLATMNAGNGTIQLGVGTGGTTTKFGLPARLGGTTDIKRLSGCLTGVGTQTAGTFFFGGTPASAGDSTYHAVKAPRDLAAGTWVLNVVYRPTFLEERPTTYF